MPLYRAIGKSGEVLAQVQAADLKAADTELARSVKRHGKSRDWKTSGYAVDEFVEADRWVRVAGDPQ